MIERLEALPAFKDKTKDQEISVNHVKALLTDLGSQRVLFILDGLDEIVSQDNDFVKKIVLALQCIKKNLVKPSWRVTMVEWYIFSVWKYSSIQFLKIPKNT